MMLLKKTMMEHAVKNIENYTKFDLIYFLIGCSFTFENPQINSGICLKHINENKNVIGILI